MNIATAATGLESDAGIGDGPHYPKLLSQQQLATFQEDGFLILKDLFNPIELFAGIYAGFNQVLSGIEETLYATGDLGSEYFASARGLPFGPRLISLAEASGQMFVQPFDIGIPRRKLSASTPMHLTLPVFQLLTHRALLDAIEDLIGGEIALNPVQHIRIKLPIRVTQMARQDSVSQKIAWHQDNAVVLPDADDTPTITVWLPLTKATTENGCLAVVPGSHHGGLVEHCTISGQLNVPDKRVARDLAIPVPLDPGSILLMHRRTIHCGLDNVSESSVRISYDLRYQPADMPTGRQSMPSFIIRSRDDPSREVHDAASWRDKWFEARDRLAMADGVAKAHRWSGDGELCA